METRTSELIERLSKMETKEDIENEVQESFNDLSESLSDRGYTFEEETQNFRGGQSILDRDFSDYSYYNELNFIKDGLGERWVAVMDDYTNFKEIEDSVNDIIIKLY